MINKRFLVFLFLFNFVQGVLACSTPVFRYAIERWEADPYRLMVFTDGELTESQEEIVDRVKQYERYGYRRPPLIVTQVEISETTNLSAEVWGQVSTNQSAPAVALLYPSIMRDNSPVWIDELSSNALNRIVMSPARLETATRLLDGDAAVWILIRGDDPKENEEVRALLEASHNKIESGTVYNDDFLQQIEAAGGDVPELRFSVLEVDRNDPRESVFLSMLTHTSKEVSEHSGPVVIPIYGQARAAVIMMDKFIAEKYIESIAEFLTGACSCEIKSLNPGFDLLIPVDWIGGIRQEYVFDSELPPLTSPSAALAPVEEPAEDLAEIDSQPVVLEKSETGLFSGVLGVFLLIVFGILACTTWLMVRKKS